VRQGESPCVITALCVSTRIMKKNWANYPSNPISKLRQNTTQVSRDQAPCINSHGRGTHEVERYFTTRQAHSRRPIFMHSQAHSRRPSPELNIKKKKEKDKMSRNKKKMGYPVSNLEAEPTIISNKCNPRTKYHSQKVVHQLSHNTYQGPRSNLQVVVSTSSQQWSNVFSLQVTGDPQIGTHDLRQTAHMYITHTTNDRPMRQLFGAQHHNPQAKARKKKNNEPQ
jgi:hypothetical protein